MDRFLKRPVTATNEVNEKQKTKVRKYDEEYLQYGFIEVEGKPKCLICLRCLANEAMKPAKLKRHLETKHPDYVKKDRAFFERKGED